jgi:hypothetical protein
MIRKLSCLAAAAVLVLPAVGLTQPPRPPGWTCVTQFGWCLLRQYVPPGSQCFCQTPQGQIYGRVR